MNDDADADEEEGRDKCSGIDRELRMERNAG
jgi:hypothetical protein